MLLRTVRVDESLDDAAEEPLPTASRLSSDPHGKESPWFAPIGRQESRG